MKGNDKIMNITSEYLIDIYKAATKTFCNGIYVPVKNHHPCGWDFINFDYVEDILTHIFDIQDISNGIYDYHPYEDMTLAKILVETKGKFAFEISGVDEW